MQNKEPCVYILTNISNRVLYVGVTSNLVKRICEHKEKCVEGFTKKYNLAKLVYYESCPTMEAAIVREKQIKGWLRSKKISLIESQNKEWRDLYDEIV